VAKKAIKTNKQNNPDSVAIDDSASASAKIEDAEQQIKTLIEKGEKKGFLTYEEMNRDLPDEAVSPSRLESLLATLDAMGVSLVDEDDVESQQAGKAEAEFEADEELSEEQKRGKKSQPQKSICGRTNCSKESW